jgi:hypothetical protein
MKNLKPKPHPSADTGNNGSSPKPSPTAVRGKYYNRLQQGTNLVILDPDLMPHFPDSASVNRALHAFLAINEQVQSAANRVRTRRRPASISSADFDPRVGTQSAPASR